MNRMTDRYDGQAMLLCENEKCKIYSDGMCSAVIPCYAEQNAIDKLCAYEEAEERGELVCVKRGKWLDGYEMQTCSCCAYRGKRSYNYCPRCGADMREADNG